MNRTLRASRAAVIATLAATALLAGCSSSSGTAGEPGGDLKGVSASDAMKKSREAAKSATAVTVDATPAPYTTVLASMGPQGGITKITVDPSKGASPAPKNVKVENVEVRAIGDVVYVKADAQFWVAEVGAAGAAKIGDKWVAAKAGSALYQRVGAFTTKDTLTSSLLATGDTRLKYAEVAEVDGVQAVKIVADTTDPSASASASPSASASGTDVPGIWIAIDAPNYPVKLEGPGGAGQPGVSYKFMDWNKAPTVEAPPASEVIAYSAVPKKATKGNASGQ